MFRPLAFALAASIAACGGLPPQTVREQGPRTVIESPEAPAVVYRRFVTGSRVCRERMMEIASDYFPDNQTGSVSASLRSDTAHSALYVADISPTPTGSAVSVALHPSAGKLAPKLLGDMREWIAGRPRCTD